MEKIRNFVITAHIDHGKSTLADRLLEITGTVEKRAMRAQLLDKMELERERGITIKLAPVRLKYQGYELNLIDTPGHVDFAYEVSRSLAAVEGAILLVDATQGIQAQTLSNFYLAAAAKLTIIPVINKIDLPAADVAKSTKEIVNLLGCDPADIIRISAKTGENVAAVLAAIINRVPPPLVAADKCLRALVFDSYYDDFRGVILYVRVFNGELVSHQELKLMATGVSATALEVGTLQPEMHAGVGLKTGEIGYIVTNLKTTREAKVGDSVTSLAEPANHPLPGYRNVLPFVYAGFFPVSGEDYQALKMAIEKLALSDSALQFTPENSPVLGFGVRVGFLGLLHLDIVRERLEREYDLELVVTNPSTNYHIRLFNGTEMEIKSAADLPDQSSVAEIKEPWIKGEIVAPKNYVGALLQLIALKRGRQNSLSYVDDQALIDFEAPLANLLTDFYDQLKSLTAGYGSFNYELADYRAGDLVRLDFFIAGDRVDALSVVVHRTEAQVTGRQVVGRLKNVIPRQNFQVALQAAIGGKIIAREDLPAYRKDVTSGLYGGDVSRKKKVLAKQKKGKERLKRFGRVDIPAEAFTVILRRE